MKKQKKSDEMGGGGAVARRGLGGPAIAQDAGRKVACDPSNVMVIAQEPLSEILSSFMSRHFTHFRLCQNSGTYKVPPSPFIIRRLPEILLIPFAPRNLSPVTRSKFFFFYCPKIEPSKFGPGPHKTQFSTSEYKSFPFTRYFYVLYKILKWTGTNWRNDYNYLGMITRIYRSVL